MSEHAEPPQSSGTSPDGSSPGEAVAEEWSDGDGDESSFGVSNDPATHGVADAAELLALREALSEKELQILEMRQSMADEEEENARTLTSARKELAAKVRESAVRRRVVGNAERMFIVVAVGPLLGDDLPGRRPVG